jgi:hypothetical protein
MPLTSVQSPVAFAEVRKGDAPNSKPERMVRGYMAK